MPPTEHAGFFCNYFRGDCREAEMWITKTPSPENPNYHLIAAAIFAESGNVADVNASATGSRPMHQS